MRIRYLETNIPPNYHINPANPSDQLEVKRPYQGKTYQLLGTSEKIYTFKHRVWVGIRAFVKTFFSLGFGLFRQEIKDDWTSFWAGKRVVAMYTCSSFLATQVYAKQGDKTALYELGVIFDKVTNGVLTDHKLAFDYYLKAADKGHPEALLKVAKIYKDGKLISTDNKKAFEYFQKAAELGNKDAQVELGKIYANGECGIAKNYDKALDYIEPLADKGHAEASYLMGEFYKKGLLGLPRDNDAALKYFKLSANAGNSKAKGLLLILENSFKFDFNLEPLKETVKSFFSTIFKKDS